MTLTIKHRRVYGRDIFEPVCDRANAFCKLTGTKTLTKEHINILQSIGYEIIVEQDTVTF